MKTRAVLGLCALVVAGVGLAAMPLQDAKAKVRDDKSSAAAPDMEAMMAACMEAAKLGKEHAELAKAVGTWKVAGKHWMDPNAPAMESTGTSTYELVLGGRYLREHHMGDMGPMGTFEGMGILAFNNVTGEYEHVWMDTMGTGTMRTTGKPAADGSVTMTGKMDCPLTKGKIPVRFVSRVVNANERHFEMHMTQDGKESKCMELVYTRVAGR